ncbi:hypothetical protein [Streptomyces arboris]|uniref:hypothetical protein n=1 Tax=Streptomyces arboris TaxID=2600619 RepID=UPI003BF4B7BE
MTTDTSALHQPLYDPATDGTYTPPLDIVLACARDNLAECADANIHNPTEMLSAAVRLHIRLRQLVAAIDQEARRG